MSPAYCKVALPVPLRSTFAYAVPAPLQPTAQVGSRVLVPFRNRALVGVVLGLGEDHPKAAPVKDVLESLDALPALPPKLVELGRWVSDYYLAPPGEVFRALLPPQVELRTVREWRLTAEGHAALANLASRPDVSTTKDDELALLQLLEKRSGVLRGPALRRLAGGEALAERLRGRGWLDAREFARRRKERTQKIVAWSPEAGEPAGPAEERLRDLLLTSRGPLPLPVALKQARVSRALVGRLVNQGKLSAWEEPLSASQELWEMDFTPPANQLNAEQQRAAHEVESWLAARRFTVGLLYGVTGSGKTEVYLRAVETALAQGRTALILVPEIALTLWMARLVRARFGDAVAVLHSGLPDLERAREWWRARRGEAKVVVGTRSAVFAPLENVGLIVVDEEQEASYKQEETPRYHGRDTAIVRAKLEGAVALLGSATPSLESFHHARSGKYRLLELAARVEDRPLARVEVVDLREDFRRAQRALPVSERVRAALVERLAQGTQAVVLINRRGYSWFVLCRSCGAALQCQNCSISLTFHKKRQRLVCHYCGYACRVPENCPKCRSEYLYFVGEGAERIEEYLREQFPAARLGRLDRDTVRTKREYQDVLGAFAGGQLDILVGTQMVAKGHDFQRVTLVGVLSADRALGLPDFRAAERTFQLLTQVAGRAGRGQLAGEVLVETYHPEHYAIQHAARQDYPSFAEQELRFRRLMHYPPFTALANVIVRDRQVERAIRWSRQLATFFAPYEAQGLKVLGPAAAALARLKREYRFQLLLKSPQRSRLTQVLGKCLEFCAAKQVPETAVIIDVDPVSLF